MRAKGVLGAWGGAKKKETLISTYEERAHGTAATTHAHSAAEFVDCCDNNAEPAPLPVD